MDIYSYLAVASVLVLCIVILIVTGIGEKKRERKFRNELLKCHLKIGEYQRRIIDLEAALEMKVGE